MFQHRIVRARTSIAGNAQADGVQIAPLFPQFGVGISTVFSLPRFFPVNPELGKVLNRHIHGHASPLRVGYFRDLPVQTVLHHAGKTTAFP